MGSLRSGRTGTLQNQHHAWGALGKQKKFAEAEPLLLEGYSGMKDREQQIPPAAQPRLAEAIRRKIDLCTAWDKPEEAAKWRWEE